MDDFWHTLNRTEPIGGVDQLQLARSLVVASAVERHRDFTLIQCLRSTSGDESETLIVDVKCNGVPPNNRYGIEFVERLALHISKDSKQLVDVLAMRKDFPLLMHQNHVWPGMPLSLCLYYEPVRSVLRTWTPQDLLRRIQFWLERTANGTLHPADQPVEQLFFTRPDQLVLPWNFNEQCSKLDVRFSIFRSPERRGSACTFFLANDAASSARQPGKIEPIRAFLPAVVQGRPEVDPPTLGELADMLLARNVDLRQILIQTIQERVGDGGVPADAAETFAVLLLHIPVTRQLGQAAEKMTHRAYLMDHGVLQIGVAIGALYLLNGRYFRELTEGALAAPPKDDWRLEQMLAIEVVAGLDGAMARRQSGVAEIGPAAAALVGAGALGATMLDLWTRSAWGQWTVIDSDYIKPHNLVRHPANASHIGSYKSEVARDRHNDIMCGASQMQAINADACEFSDEKLCSALTSSELIVDASTTLDYPRLASTRDDFGRHVSVFLTPNGRDSVLLLEDSARSIKLRTLEAQYYRAAIGDSWGNNHLDGNMGTFWSGASCRDISMVMPFSSISAHAATLAEQVRLLSATPEPAIRIWSRNTSSGVIAAHTVPAHPDRRIQFNGIDLFIDEGVVAKMMTMRETNLPNETGGIVLGYFDLNVNAVFVVDTLAAPADSVSASGSFKRGIAGVLDAATEANRRTAGVVGYIGEWHSHPPGCPANPSKDDFYQLAYLALGMNQDGLPAVSLIVGADGDLQAMVGEVRG